MRIWYQSFTDPALHGSYLDPLSEYLERVADPGVEIVVGGMRPHDRGLSRLSEFRCAAQAIEHAILAERAGYDAVVIGHFQDPGLHEARCALRRPVIGLGEAGIRWAGTLGRAFGLVTIDPVYVSWHSEQVERYGLRERCAGVRALTGLTVEDYVAAFETDAARRGFLEAFRAAAQPLVDAGAEVIIPAGGLPAMLCSRERGMEVGGAVLLEPVAVAVKAVESAVELERHTGLRTSRAGAFASAPEQAIDDMLALTGPTSPPELRP